MESGSCVNQVMSHSGPGVLAGFAMVLSTSGPLRTNKRTKQAHVVRQSKHKGWYILCMAIRPMART